MIQAMSHPQAPQRQTTANETQRYAKAVHNVALLAIVACPLLALLPPRKFDVYTIALIGTTGYSANYLSRERGGPPIWQYVAGRSASSVESETPVHTLLEKADLRREIQHWKGEEQPSQPEQSSILHEVQATKTSRDAWKVQRDKEIKEGLDEGKGFGDMIMDQIWEVWNWGKNKEDDDDG